MFTVEQKTLILYGIKSGRFASLLGVLLETEGYFSEEQSKFLNSLDVEFKRS